MRPNGRKAIEKALELGMSERGAVMFCLQSVATNQSQETIFAVERVMRRVIFPVV